MIYGYARVSTKEQNEDRQLIAFKESGYKFDRIFLRNKVVKILIGLNTAKMIKPVTVKYSYVQGTVTRTEQGGSLIGYVESAGYCSSDVYVITNIIYCYASGLVNSGNGSCLIGDINSRSYVYIRYWLLF